MVTEFLRRWPFGESIFVRHVITLMAGTGLAQAVPIIAAPLLTRLYAPSDYGMMTLYTTYVGLMGIGANGLYANAIVIAKTDDDATNLFALSTIITIIFCFIATAIIVVFHEDILSLLQEESMSVWLYLIPLSIFLASFYQSQNNWLNRNQRFGTLASNRVVQAVVGTGLQLILGFTQLIYGGLILSIIISQLLATMLLSWRIWHTCALDFRLVSLHKMIQQIREHWRFPIYSLPTDFLNLVVNRAPVFLLNIFSGVAALGYYGFALRIIGLPTGLLAGSVSDVFRQRASNDYRENNHCVPIYRKTFRSLSLIGIVPFLTLFIIAPTLFPIVFGDQWREAGEYTRWLSIMYFFGFVSSPLSYLYYIVEKQGEDLLLHIYMLISTIATMYLGFWHFESTVQVIALFSVNYASIYIIYLVRSYTFAKGLYNVERSVS